MAKLDPIILQRYHTELETVFGDRLARVVLFVSPVRGVERSDSDCDVAVFLYKMGSFCEEILTLAEIESTISRETGIIINSLIFSADKAESPTILPFLKYRIPSDHMKEVAKVALAQAERRLRNARVMLKNSMPDEAADTAYNVYLRTMEAYLFGIGYTPRLCHGKTRTNFFNIKKFDPRFNKALENKIIAASKIKNSNDYGYEMNFISQKEASDFVNSAAKFYRTIKNIIINPVSSPNDNTAKKLKVKPEKHKNRVSDA